ncbi:hypothetical protein [Hyphomicrobium sp.]|uniref:hypothetical protein n=1 Tax=Hyphomicrobium sp. TaxID=82 RepID=UPI002D78396A|nr:hypothetical protein [Hyphomicrobium sp.]HET6389538.1 hypothetical protein [Hyphomicrobium sp.]
MRRGFFYGWAVATTCLWAVTAGSGCAVYMAATQPGEKDLSVLSAGQPRARLIAELGPPVSTQVERGVRTDIFSFTQGYNGGVKAGRAILHGAADVATFGLWEAVGTPTEGYFSGRQLSAQVTYDHNDIVTAVVPLKGSEEIQAVMTDAQPQPIVTSSTR